MEEHKGHRKNMSPEELYQRRLRLRNKFKACIRLIIANVTWLQELEDESLGDNVNKNIAVLTRKKGEKNLMTLADKAILNQPPEERSEEDKRRLRDIFSKIKCFKRYPAKVLDELPSIAFFSCFTPNRNLIKQGYEPMYMYVLLSGEVLVSQTYYSNLEQQVVTKDLMIIGPGTIFGELALLYNTTRAATVKTLSNAEFIWFGRDDFYRVIRPVIAKFYFEIETSLAHLDYFRDWSQGDIREACMLCKKKYFQIDQVILSETIGNKDFVHFVTKGSCYLLEHILVKVDEKSGKKKEILITEISNYYKSKVTKEDLHNIRTNTDPDTGFESKHSLRPSITLSLRPSVIHTSNGSATTRIVRICTFHKLACFNVGESLKNRFIVAEEDTELVLLPRFFLDEKSLLTFQIVQQYLTKNIPNTKKIFEKYVEEKKWCIYKENLFKKLRQGLKTNNSNCISNVPYTIRLGENLGEF